MCGGRGMNNFKFYNTYNTISPITLKDILNSCSVDTYLIAIIDGSLLQDNTLFIGDFFKLPYELIARIEGCRTCISGVTLLTQETFQRFRNNFNSNSDYFFLTEKDLGQYVLELTVNTGGYTL